MPVRYIRVRSQTAAKRKRKKTQADPVHTRFTPVNKRKAIFEHLIASMGPEEKLNAFREFFSKHTPILYGRVMAKLGEMTMVADTTPAKLGLKKKRLPFRKLCYHKGSDMKLVCGDEVMWWPGPTMESPGKVMHMLPRNNVFARSRIDRQGVATEVALASNIAQMAIVIAPRPHFNTKVTCLSHV